MTATFALFALAAVLLAVLVCACAHRLPERDR